ncbi:unnamed protein product [Rotaria socialis]|uniref:Uncharacterized protein n=2 Tax=Rotaria socialis TaxID=392032 RepID=A0A820XM11_9BILA|nr:unnamed protein product [Rotaria socialis]CAF4825942.1 unnamed protein product [Rotaria socialis]
MGPKCSTFEMGGNIQIVGKMLKQIMLDKSFGTTLSKTAAKIIQAENNENNSDSVHLSDDDDNDKASSQEKNIVVNEIEIEIILSLFFFF